MQIRDARQRVARSIGFAGTIRTFSKQLHGVQIFEAVSENDPPVDVKGDGWIIKTRGVAAGIFMADCVPLFLWNKDFSIVGVFHAGWRGMAAGMPEAAVAAFVEAGEKATDLSAALGPHIGACCYRIGEELRPQFDKASVRRAENGWTLDLGAEARRRLAAAGVRPNSVSSVGLCTHCREDEFFSFRRDKIRRNMMALISLPLL